MTAYYNEIEAYPAAWLVNLAKAGHIAPGTVDNRSIVDVQPDDVSKFTQAHFFAGIGVWSYALRLAGWPDDRPVWTGSCPCQPFSAAGKRGGTDDPRHLWPEWFRLIRECRPPVIFGEQVASKDGLAWLDLVYADLESAGYAVAAFDLCAAGAGAPHIRQRIYFVAHTESCNGGLSILKWGSRQDNPEFEWSSEAGDLAHANDQRGQTQRQLQRKFDVEGRRDAITLGNTSITRDGTQHGQPGQGGEQQEQAGGSSISGVNLGDTSSGIIATPTRRVTRREQAQRRASSSTTRWCTWHPGQPQQRRTRWGARAGADRKPENGHAWSDVEWLPCRDGKARPIQPGLCPLANGATGRMVFTCTKCGTETITDENLRSMRKINEGYPKQKILLAPMYGEGVYETTRNEGGGSVSSAEYLPGEFLRELWKGRLEITQASQRPQPDQQQSRKYHDTVFNVPCETTQESDFFNLRSMWETIYSSITQKPEQDMFCGVCETMGPHQCKQAVASRVGELRSYGNAIVAPLAAEFIRAYMECEET